MWPTSDFDGVLLVDHAVPGCQVAVHQLLLGEVGHAVGDLARHLQHGAHRRRLARVALLATTKTNT